MSASESNNLLMPELVIQGRRIGPDHPTYVIAELSANHNQSFDEAVTLVKAAKAAGADAVKLQTYTPDTITIDVDGPMFRPASGSLWEGRTLYQLYGEAYTPWPWQPKLKALADGLGIHLFSSAFDATAVEFLEQTGMPAHKVASFELVDLPLIEKMARTKKPLIMSTGMATLDEIEEAVNAARRAGATQIALLKCTSAYPAPPEEVHLRTLVDLAARFHVVIGLSDHTLGIAVPVAAVALGARVVEKHFTLSREVKGPDSAFSLEPAEFTAMVDAIRTTEKALGTIHYGMAAKEAQNRQFRRSLFVVENIKAGEPFTATNVRSIRPGHGLPPKHFDYVLTKKAAVDLDRGTPLRWDVIA